MLGNTEKNVTMSYKEWVEYAAVNFDIVSKNYNRRMYENIVEDPVTHEMNLVQLTLGDVFNKCEGTNLEMPIRSAVMKAVYTNDKLERGIKRVMDDYYEV